MVKVNKALLIDALKYPDDNHSLNLVRKSLRRDLRDFMPKKYGFIPKDPKVYRISKSIAFELPSWGSYAYRLELSSLSKFLRENFICDIQYFDGKTTFVVREWKKN